MSHSGVGHRNLTFGNQSHKKRVIRPPTNYDHREHVLDESKKIICSRYPELQDLALAGTLVAVPRSSTYSERRTDGYREPEMIFLLGTSHVSTKAAEEVERCIHALKPENVVVELCKSRSHIMYDIPSSKMGNGVFDLSGGDVIDTMQRSIQLGGRGALLLRLLLSYTSSRFAERINAKDLGSEFVAARKGAEEIHAQIVLGDRPIEVTLRRAWENLSLLEKVDLLQILIKDVWAKDGQRMSLEQLEDLRSDDDTVNAILNRLSEKFPKLAEALVYERDLYLAWSLKRSKAVNGTSNVLGVIGKGHMRGICYALTHDNGNLRFRDIAGSKKISSEGLQSSAGRFAIESIAFFLLYYAWTGMSQ